MNTIRHIRTAIFNLSQSDFAKIAGVQQGTVSRWESGTPLSVDEMKRIRSEAIKRKLPWDDAYFFEDPIEAAE